MTNEKWKSVREARELILSRIVPVAAKTRAPLRDVLGRVLAEDIAAPFNVPGFDNSAMDGYACRIADLSADKNVSLRIAGRAFAGAPSDCAIANGECVRIMTGARVPAGADIVVPQEESCGEKDGIAEIAPAVRRTGTHIRLAGEDLRCGEIALAAGTFCAPAEIGLLGSLGITETAVYRRVRVAYFSTGDELKSPGDSLAPGEVYDSNRHAIFAMLARMGADGLDLGVVRDSPEMLAAAMDAATENADVVIASGGASVGEADFIRPVLAERGEVVFWKVAMRPGRPLAFGKLGEADFFGLPGNPVSVMVCFYQFVQAALWKRAGRKAYSPPPMLEAVALCAFKKSAGREEYQRGVLRPAAGGGYEVSPTGDQGSGILSSMTRANCFIVLEESRGAVAAGEKVCVQMFEGLV